MPHARIVIPHANKIPFSLARGELISTWYDMGQDTEDENGINEVCVTLTLDLNTLEHKKDKRHNRKGS